MRKTIWTKVQAIVLCAILIVTLMPLDKVFEAARAAEGSVSAVWAPDSVSPTPFGITGEGNTACVEFGYNSDAQAYNETIGISYIFPDSGTSKQLVIDIAPGLILANDGSSKLVENSSITKFTGVSLASNSRTPVTGFNNKYFDNGTYIYDFESDAGSNNEMKITVAMDEKYYVDPEDNIIKDAVRISVVTDGEIVASTSIDVARGQMPLKVANNNPSGNVSADVLINNGPNGSPITLNNWHGKAYPRLYISYAEFDFLLPPGVSAVEGEKTVRSGSSSTTYALTGFSLVNSVPQDDGSTLVTYRYENFDETCIGCQPVIMIDGNVHQAPKDIVVKCTEVRCLPVGHIDNPIVYTPDFSSSSNKNIITYKVIENDEKIEVTDILGADKTKIPSLPIPTADTPAGYHDDVNYLLGKYHIRNAGTAQSDPKTVTLTFVDSVETAPVCGVNFIMLTGQKNAIVPDIRYTIYDRDTNSIIDNNGEMFVYHPSGKFASGGTFELSSTMVGLEENQYFGTIQYDLDYTNSDGAYGILSQDAGTTPVPNYQTYGGMIFDFDAMRNVVTQTMKISVVDMYESENPNPPVEGVAGIKVTLGRTNNENYYLPITTGSQSASAGTTPIELSVKLGCRQTSSTTNAYAAAYDPAPTIYIRDVYATSLDNRTIGNIKIVNNLGVDIMERYSGLITPEYYLDDTGCVVCKIDTSPLLESSLYADKYAAAIGFFDTLNIVKDTQSTYERTLHISWTYNAPATCKDSTIYNLCDCVYVRGTGNSSNSAYNQGAFSDPYGIAKDGEVIVKPLFSNIGATFQVVAREDIAITTSGKRYDAPTTVGYESWAEGTADYVLIEPGARYVIRNEIFNNSGSPTSDNDNNLNYIYIPVPHDGDDWGEINSGIPANNPNETVSEFTYTMTLNSPVENPLPEKLSFAYAEIDLTQLGITSSTKSNDLGGMLRTFTDWDSDFDYSKNYNVIRVAIKDLPAASLNNVPELCLDVTPDANAAIGSVNIFQALYWESVITSSGGNMQAWATSQKLALQVAKGSVSGYVWKDSNGNGIMDAGEPGLEGVQVTLTKTNDSDAEIYDPNSEYSSVITTGPDGEFSFEMLPSDNYSVTFEQAGTDAAVLFDEYMASTPNNSPSDTDDSDAIAITDGDGNLIGATISDLEIPYYPSGNRAIFARDNESFGMAPKVTVEYQLMTPYPDEAVVPESVTIVAGSEFTPVYPDSIQGYTFVGWYKSSGFLQNQKFEDGSTVNPTKGSITYQLYGKWVPISYEVAFDSNVPTDCPTTVDGTMQNQTHVYNSSLALTDNGYTLPGYEFQGWAPTADGSVTYENKESVTNLSDTDGSEVTLYAVWAPKTITITYVLKYDNDGKPETDTQDVVFGTSNITLRHDAETGVRGYTTTGWNTEEDGSGTNYGIGAKTTIATVSPNGEDVTLYAIRELTGYIITYDANGGDGSVPDSVEALNESAIIAENGFTRDNYSFVEWNTKADGTGVSYNSGVYVDPLTTEAKSTVTLYAIWQGNPCTINFDKNAANATETVDSMENVDFESEVTLPANGFSYTGYHFTGWNTVADGSGITYIAGDKTTTLTSTAGATVTLFAQWEANTYSVVYDANNGTGSMNATVATYDEEFSLEPNAYTRTGYEFTGWATSENGPVTYTDGQTNLINLTSVENGSVTLYAVWSANTYSIAFDGNGNDGGSMTSINATYDKEVTLPANGFTRTGYTFAGWELGNQSFADKAVVENLATSGEVTLIAQWTPNTYTIAYNANGGVGTMENTEATYDVNVTLRSNSFTRTGYTFVGWALQANGVATFDDGQTGLKNFTSTDKGTVTLYAIWQANTYTIKFDGNGATKGTTPDQTVTYDEIVNLTINGYTRIGYTFAGWENGNDLLADGAAVNNLAPSGEITLKARWQANNYTIVYNNNGGDGTMSNQPMVFDADAVALYDNAFTRTGYTFKGWSTIANGTVEYGNKASVQNLTSDPNGVVTLYAVWSVNHYHIRFVENGGTGTPMDDIDNVAYDAEVVIPANEYTRTGYTFTGWNTKADGTGTAYAVGDKVTKLAALDNLLVFLYAQWTPNNYTIIYNGNGATDGSMSNQPMVYDASAVELYANGFTRTGYVFAGWSTTADGNVEYVDSESVQNLTSVPGGEFNLYAVWTPNNYTISFDANGAEGAMDDIDATYDVEVTLTENDFELTGYTFQGWALTEDGDAEIDDGADVKNLTPDVDGAVTLYAVWAPNHYTVVFDTNGGEGEMDNLPMIYDAEEEIPTTEDYVRDGYFFIGWAEDADQPYPDYVRGQKVMNLASDEGAVVTLYAVWQEGAYISVYAEDNGEASSDVNYIMSGNDVAITITPDEGYRIASITNNDEPIDRTELILDEDGNFVYTLKNVKGNNEIIVKFEAKPSEADCDVIIADGTALEFFIDETIKLTAIGAWEDDEVLLEGDVKFVPNNWHHANPSGNWDSKDDAAFDYSDTFSQPAAGKYTVHVEFDKYIYTAGEWVKDSVVTRDATYIVKARPAVPTATPTATPTPTAPADPATPVEATATPTATPTPAGGTVATGESASVLPYVGGAMVLLAMAIIVVVHRRKEEQE